MTIGQAVGALAVMALSVSLVGEFYLLFECNINPRKPADAFAGKLLLVGWIGAVSLFLFAGIAANLPW